MECNRRLPGNLINDRVEHTLQGTIEVIDATEAGRRVVQKREPQTVPRPQEFILLNQELIIVDKLILINIAVSKANDKPNNKMGEPRWEGSHS